MVSLRQKSEIGCLPMNVEVFKMLKTFPSKLNENVWDPEITSLN